MPFAASALLRRWTLSRVVNGAGGAAPAARVLARTNAVAKTSRFVNSNIAPFTELFSGDDRSR
jgi:hypothetical protein